MSISFDMNAFDEGDITGGDTGELTIVDDNFAGYGDIKEGEQDAI